MVTRLEHVPSTSNIAESRCASEASFSVFGTFSTGPKRATPAQRVRELMNLLLDLVRSEWEAIRALNLGIRSGTDIVDELLLQKLRRWVQELHMLCITRPEAARTITKMTSTIELGNFQQLQVLLDTSDHTDFSDYLRVTRFNTTDPFAIKPVGIIEKIPLVSSTRQLSIRSSRSSIHVKAMPEKRPIYKPLREEIVRFTGFLPEDHSWSQKAYTLHLARHPIQERRASSAYDEEKSAAAAEREAQAAALRAYPEILGPCKLIEMIRPPRSKTPEMRYAEVDVEALWRKTTHTVHKDVILDEIIMQHPSPVWQILPQYKQQQAAAEVAAAASDLKATRLSSATVRPAFGTPGSTRTPGSFMRNTSIMRARTPQIDHQISSGESQQPNTVSPLGKLPPAAPSLSHSSTPRREASSDVTNSDS